MYRLLITSITTNTVKSPLKSFMTSHFSYKRDDGSFSAFGSRDESGSLWLTAFVAKCFVYTSQVRSELLVQLEGHVTDAFRFVASNQNEDGSFNDPGRVIHKSMQVVCSLGSLLIVV